MPEYLSAQDIFNKCFNAATNEITVSTGQSLQDCLNAVFDSENNSIRISVSGGGSGEGVIYTAGEGITIINNQIAIDTTGAEVGDVLVMTESGVGWSRFDTSILSNVVERLSVMPEAVETNLGRTVLYTGVSVGGVKSGGIYTLELAGDDFEWVSVGLVGGSAPVRQEVITLPFANPPNQVLVSVNGVVQDIDDDGDIDGEPGTYYRIDFIGHVLSVENYASSDATLSDRYFCKMSYDVNINVTSIFMTVAEYETFSQLGNGKNVLKVNYL